MEKVYLWSDPAIRTQNDRVSITPMLVDDDKIHPAVLVIPGGGYGVVCLSTEGFPIAGKFNELGYHAFILDYRTAPNRWPLPQLDAMRAMKVIRSNAQKFRVDPGQVAVCGFSAGAHLAGSLGILCDELAAVNGDEADAFPHRPDVMILCYGVLSFSEWNTQGTQMNLLGENYRAIRHEYSLVEKVNSSTPPAFLMHTICDQIVPYRNSLEFADAMGRCKRPCELALYNWGDHGMLLGLNTLDVISWPERAHCFMQSLRLEQQDAQFLERYTNSYQNQQNQLEKQGKCAEKL